MFLMWIPTVSADYFQAETGDKIFETKIGENNEMLKKLVAIFAIPTCKNRQVEAIRWLGLKKNHVCKTETVHKCIYT
jgi:hypothetical protein